MNKLDDLVVVVEACRPDVIGISETWATAEVLDSELGLDGYVMFREDRKNCAAARGGGVLLYVLESLSPGEFRPVTGFPEHVWCRIKGRGGEELLIGVCYRSGSDIFSDDNNELARDLIEEVSGKCVLLMGDFNYPGIGWRGGHSEGASVEGVKFRDCVEDNFFTQYVNSPTRDGNILDLVLCNEPDMIGNLEVIDRLANSDHNMIS